MRKKAVNLPDIRFSSPSEFSLEDKNGTPLYAARWDESCLTLAISDDGPEVVLTDDLARQLAEALRRLSSGESLEGE